MKRMSSAAICDSKTSPFFSQKAVSVLAMLFLLTMPAPAFCQATEDPESVQPYFDPLAEANPTLHPVEVIIQNRRQKHVIKLEVARSTLEQARGLMNRSSIGRYEGMIFPVQTGPAAFWMYRTQIPLDIVFVRSDGRVAKVLRGRPHDTGRYGSNDAISFVIEVEAGKARSFGLKKGARIDVQALRKALGRLGPDAQKIAP